MALAFDGAAFGFLAAVAPRRWGSSTTVQTLLFNRAHFTPASAAVWARGHGFKAAKVDASKPTLRVRQHSPSICQRGRLRTIPFRPGVQAVVCAKRRG